MAQRFAAVCCRIYEWFQQTEMVVSIVKYQAADRIESRLKDSEQKKGDGQTVRDSVKQTTRFATRQENRW